MMQKKFASRWKNLREWFKIWKKERKNCTKFNQIKNVKQFYEEF